MKTDTGFSGLEAAIIMIAFVIVAATFGYGVLNSGFFATQKFQDVTYAGLKQSTSVAATDGLIRGVYDTNNGVLTDLIFILSIPVTGESIDLSKMIYYYVRNSEEGTEIPLEHVTPRRGIVRPGESTRIHLDLEGAGVAGPSAGGSFSLEVKPPTGASTLIQRTISSGYNGGLIA
ncbi:MAG: flagellin [Methanospirillum sp.]|nr:flagellin [Methanospirillum sp.]